MGRRTAVTLAAVLVVGLVVGFAASAMAGGDDPTEKPARTITVSSTATVETAPDVAVVDVSVRSEDPDGEQAFAQNAEDMQRVLDALKGAGIAEEDIRTLNVSLDRRTQGRGEPSERTVFVASNSVEVMVRDLDAVGTVIDAAVGAGADEVRDIRFELSDPTNVRAQALEQAVEGAREKADALAGAAGTEVTGVVTIAEEGSRIPVYREAAADFAYGAALAAPTPIVPPDALEASVTVTVVWAMA